MKNKSATKPPPVHTLEDIARAVHAAGGEVKISLIPKFGIEATLLRATEIQQTILHGLQNDNPMTPEAVRLLVQATIHTIHQALTEIPHPLKSSGLNTPAAAGNLPPK